MRLRQILIFLFLISIHISVNAADIRVEMKTNLGISYSSFIRTKHPKQWRISWNILKRIFIKYAVSPCDIRFYDSRWRIRYCFQAETNQTTDSKWSGERFKEWDWNNSNGAHIGSALCFRAIFINVANNGFLNYKAPSQSGYGYTVFGKVITGMEVVNKIASAPTGSGGPFSGDVPKNSVIIEEIIKLPVPEKQSPQ